MREQFLNGELFYTLKEAQILSERWRIHDNTIVHTAVSGPATRARNHPASELKANMVSGEKTPNWSIIYTE